MSAQQAAARGETILVVDDDRKIVDLVTLYLRKEGYRVLQAYDGNMALDIARIERPELAILDLMLPGVNGLVVCKTLQHETGMPVIMLTARSTEEDRTRGLDLGADDYVVKPFSPRELVSRVRAVLRRMSRSEEQPEADTLDFGGLHIDIGRHEVAVQGRAIDLTPTEFRLLRTFAQAPGQVFSRQQLLDRAFEEGFEGFERNIDVHVMNLRRKLSLPISATDDARSDLPAIKTVYGIGYKLEPARR
ncbi:MAG: response regulator transcription factor [Thermomicrobiales bacterium]|jgi:DNA-binding response OmpR family regulator|nr:response regulator transcription factor [Thermomicrobiales bacterium]